MKQTIFITGGSSSFSLRATHHFLAQDQSVIARAAACLAAAGLAAAMPAGSGALASPAPPAFTATITAGPAPCLAAPTHMVLWQELDPQDSCRVTARGRAAGTTPPVFFQMQAYDAPGGPHTSPDGIGLVLFTTSGTRLKPIPLAGWSGGDAFIDPPRIVATVQGPILVVPMSATVSIHPTYDALFRLLRGRWTEIPAFDWLARVHAPAGTVQRHGNAMDWPTLRAYGAFWRPDDPECCGTGGSYIAQLRLSGARLTLEGIRTSPGELPFP